MHARCIWLLLACAACAGEAPAVAERVATSAQYRAAAALTPVSTYTVVPLTAAGSIGGSISFSGPLPSNAEFHPSFDQDVCGGEVRVVNTKVRDGAVEDVVVWLADARSGKRLPLEKRFELLSERCQLAPRVQAVIAGGTLNVRSEDTVEHRNRFLQFPVGRTVSLVTQHDYGQVVPVGAALAQAGEVMVICDHHPWTRAWLFVFDHPYFAVTDRAGAFTIDSVPPGRYRLFAWHERLGVVEDSVVVLDGSRAIVRLTLPGA